MKIKPTPLTLITVSLIDKVIGWKPEKLDEKVTEAPLSDSFLTDEIELTATIVSVQFRDVTIQRGPFDSIAIENPSFLRRLKYAITGK